MKKLVVLMLVVGMASLASAGFSLSTSASSMTTTGSVTVNMVNDGLGDLVQNVMYISVSADTVAAWDQAGGSMSVGTAMPVGSSPSVQYFMANAGTDYVSLATAVPSVTPITAGTMASFTLKGVSVGTVTLTFLDKNLGQVGTTATVNVVPEPMTMALLGLGGLFLRRKK